jgi:uncharacterized protein YqgC (DUF456 family)
MDPAWMHTAMLIIVQTFILVGLFGLIVPLFPGILVIWLAALAYGILSGFSNIGILIFIVITLLMIAGEVMDNVMMGIGARKGGASWVSIALALIAGVAGTFLLPPVGGLIAAPLSMLAVEAYRRRDWNQGWQSLKGMATGWGLSFILRFGVGLVMMLLWWLWVWASG